MNTWFRVMSSLAERAQLIISSMLFFEHVSSCKNVCRQSCWKKERKQKKKNHKFEIIMCLPLNEDSLWVIQKYPWGLLMSSVGHDIERPRYSLKVQWRQYFLFHSDQLHSEANNQKIVSLKPWKVVATENSCK